MKPDLLRMGLAPPPAPGAGSGTGGAPSTATHSKAHATFSLRGPVVVEGGRLAGTDLATPQGMGKLQHALAGKAFLTG
jgi:hypothetical protein